MSLFNRKAGGTFFGNLWRGVANGVTNVFGVDLALQAPVDAYGNKVGAFGDRGIFGSFDDKKTVDKIAAIQKSSSAIGTGLSGALGGSSAGIYGQNVSNFNSSVDGSQQSSFWKDLLGNIGDVVSGALGGEKDSNTNPPPSQPPTMFDSIKPYLPFIIGGGLLLLIMRK